MGLEKKGENRKNTGKVLKMLGVEGRTEGCLVREEIQREMMRSEAERGGGHRERLDMEKEAN